GYLFHSALMIYKILVTQVTKGS
nr:hypothetical protein [Tanacetum cinerariifolium]